MIVFKIVCDAVDNVFRKLFLIGRLLNLVKVFFGIDVAALNQNSWNRVVPDYQEVTEFHAPRT